MPRTTFYSFLLSIIGFFQWIFASFSRMLAPVYAISPLPNSVDFILICLIIAGIIFAIFQSRPWDK